MYSRLNDLCHYERHHPETIVSNRHFLKPNNPIYGETEIVIEPRQNFLPDFWGPDAWRFLDTVAKGYSKVPTYSERLQMRRFLESLTYCLPCKNCRDNFCKEVVLIEDDDLASPDAVSRWLKNLRRKIAERKHRRKHHGHHGHGHRHHGHHGHRHHGHHGHRHHGHHDSKPKSENFDITGCSACGGH